MQLRCGSTYKGVICWNWSLLSRVVRTRKEGKIHSRKMEWMLKVVMFLQWLQDCRWCHLHNQSWSVKQSYGPIHWAVQRRKQSMFLSSCVSQKYPQRVTMNILIRENRFSSMWFPLETPSVYSGCLECNVGGLVGMAMRSARSWRWQIVWFYFKIFN